MRRTSLFYELSLEGRFEVAEEVRQLHSPDDRLGAASTGKLQQFVGQASQSIALFDDEARVLLSVLFRDGECGQHSRIAAHRGQGAPEIVNHRPNHATHRRQSLEVNALLGEMDIMECSGGLQTQD